MMILLALALANPQTEPVQSHKNKANVNDALVLALANTQSQA